MLNSTGTMATSTNPMNKVHVRSVGNDVSSLSFFCGNSSNMKASPLDFLQEATGQQRAVFRSSVNGEAYLGTTSYRWNTGFFTNTITQSDVKDKENIAAIPNAKALYSGAEPHRLHPERRGRRENPHGFCGPSRSPGGPGKPNGRPLPVSGGGYWGGRTESYYTPEAPEEQLSWGLNYHEFIAPLVALVQEQEARIAALEAALGGGETQTE